MEKTEIKRSLTLSDVKIYRLTFEGKREISRCLRGGGLNKELPTVRGVHSVQYKMRILKDSDFWYDHEVALKGWVKKYTWIGDVT